MNPTPVSTSPLETPQRTGLAYFIGILGAFLIVLVLVWAMVRYTGPAPLGEARKAERAKALADLRAAETEALNNMAWQDKEKGLVRLRIQDAITLVDPWDNRILLLTGVPAPIAAGDSR